MLIANLIIALPRPTATGIEFSCHMNPPRFRSFTTALGALTTLLFLPACIFTDGPHFGGFSSIAKDPLGALETEPPDTPPNPHMDPVITRHGALSVRWTEDLTKSSNNDEPDPDEVENR